MLDRVNGVAYVALSERADQKLAKQWVESLGYKDLVTFHSSDGRCGSFSLSLALFVLFLD